MAIEIVDFPIKNGGSFHSYVKLPEGRFVCLGMMGHDSLHSLSCCCIVLILTGIACWLKHVRVWRRRRIGGSCCARSRRIPRPAGRQYDWFTFYNPPRKLIIWFYNCHSLSIILGICMFIHTHTYIYIYIYTYIHIYIHIHIYIYIYIYFSFSHSHHRWQMMAIRSCDVCVCVCVWHLSIQTWRMIANFMEPYVNPVWSCTAVRIRPTNFMFSSRTTGPPVGSSSSWLLGMWNNFVAQWAGFGYGTCKICSIDRNYILG